MPLEKKKHSKYPNPLISYISYFGLLYIFDKVNKPLLAELDK